MVDAISLDEWDRLWKHVLALWPRWKPNDAQAKLWKDRLSMFTVHRVRRAIEDAATNNPNVTPRLAHVIAAIRSKRGETHHSIRQVKITEAEAQRIKKEVAEMRREIVLMPIPQRETAFKQAMRQISWWQGRHAFTGRGDLGFEAALSENVGCDPTSWPDIVVGMVYAAAEAQEIPI